MTYCRAPSARRAWFATERTLPLSFALLLAAMGCMESGPSLQPKGPDAADGRPAPQPPQRVQRLGPDLEGKFKACASTKECGRGLTCRTSVEIRDENLHGCVDDLSFQHCLQTNLGLRNCFVFGKCTWSPTLADCIIGGAADCGVGVPCIVHGNCSFGNGQCYAGADAHCSRSESCRAAGRCVLRDERCVVVNDADCRASRVCREQGRCNAAKEECVALLDEDCRQSELCARNGQCGAQAGRCQAVDAADCQKAPVCKEHGWCAPSQVPESPERLCRAKSNAHCRQSLRCTEKGSCHANSLGHCVSIEAEPEWVQKGCVSLFPDPDRNVCGIGRAALEETDSIEESRGLAQTRAHQAIGQKLLERAGADQARLTMSPRRVANYTGAKAVYTLFVLEGVAIQQAMRSIQGSSPPAPLNAPAPTPGQMQTGESTDGAPDWVQKARSMSRSPAAVQAAWRIGNTFEGRGIGSAKSGASLSMQRGTATERARASLSGFLGCPRIRSGPASFWLAPDGTLFAQLVGGCSAATGSPSGEPDSPALPGVTNPTLPK